MKTVLSAVLIVLSATVTRSQGLNDVNAQSIPMLYAVGDSGVIIRSTNAGSTFSSSNFGSSDLNSVSSYSVFAWVAGNSGVYLRTTDKGVTWNNQVIGSGANLNSIYFIDSLSGFVVGANGLILKSIDGGNNWVSISSGTFDNLVKIEFVNASTGYIIGENGYMNKTTNTGLTWNTVSVPFVSKVLSIGVYNNTVLLGLENSKLLISTNAGSNWSVVDLKIYSMPGIKSICMKSETAFMLMLESGAMWNTTNSGVSFTYGQSPMFSDISASDFKDVRWFIVSSSHKAVLRSNNGGINWSFPSGTVSSLSFYDVLESELESSNKILDMNYQKRGVLYAGQGKELMRSMDFGENWSLLSVIPTNAKTCVQVLVSMKDSSKMIVIMNDDSISFEDTCKLFRTTDYGITWQETYRGINDKIGNMIAQAPSNPDTLYLGIKDSVMKSTDFGLTWLKTADLGAVDWCDIAVNPVNPNIIYGSTNHYPAKINKSTNGGISWFMVDFVVDTSYSEMPCIAVSNLNPNMVFHAQLSSQNQTGLKRSFSQGNTWLFSMFTGPSWSVDISKDDPSLIAYGNVSTTPVYISTNTGTTFFTIPNSWAEQLFYYDRSNLFSTDGSEVYKLRAFYEMPLIGIENISSEVPNLFRLYQNYPNPFNPITNITFDIQNRSDVKLIIFDVTGREISVPVNEILSAGTYKVTWDASENSSGIYFCRIEAEGFSETSKMVLLK